MGFGVGEFARTRYSLQFKDPGVEMAFAVGRQDRLLNNFVKLNLLVMFVSTSSLIQRVFIWDELSDNAKVSEVSELALVVIGFTVLAIVQLRTRWRCVTHHVIEVCICVMVLVVMVQIVSFEELFLDVITEADRMTSTDARLAQIGRVVLALDAVLTGSHLALPISWFVMVWVDVLALGLFMMYSLLVGGLSYDVIRCNIIFIALVCAASVGLRAQEVNERELFCTIVTERSLRAMEEFKSATRGTRSRDLAENVNDEINSESGRWVPSVASTTNTGALFERTSLNDSAINVMEDLQRLGVQEHWLIKRCQVTIFPHEVLGTGNFGKVVCGKFCSQEVAIKQCLKHKEGALDKMVCNELRILRHVRHPNLVLFHGACIDTETKDVMLVLEKVHGSNLDMTIAKLQALKVSSPYHATQTDVMRQVCQALIYLHSRSPCLVHGDLSPNNILVERRGLLERQEARYIAKLLDFGLSRTISHNSKVGGGTPHFMAPEIVSNVSDYRPRSSHDVFSLGRLLFYMASGRRPLKNMTDKEIVSLAREGRLPPVLWQPTTALLALWRGMAERCMSEDPKNRPPVQEVHDFLEINALKRKPQEKHEPALARRTTAASDVSAGSRSSGSPQVHKEHKEHIEASTSGAQVPETLRSRMSSPEGSGSWALSGGSGSWQLNCLASIPEMDTDVLRGGSESMMTTGSAGTYGSDVLMDKVLQL